MTSLKLLLHICFSRVQGKCLLFMLRTIALVKGILLQAVVLVNVDADVVIRTITDLA